jgi:hypothetical protein
MKSFAYITSKQIPSYERLEALQSLFNWLNDNVPKRWDNRGNLINFEHDEDATLCLLAYAGNEKIKLIKVG